MEFADFFEGGVAGEDFGIDLLVADAAGNELGVLAAEIENDDAAAGGHATKASNRSDARIQQENAGIQKADSSHRSAAFAKWLRPG
jgi:hypothetical protein